MLAFGDDEFADRQVGPKRRQARSSTHRDRCWETSAQIKYDRHQGSDLTFTLTGQAGDTVFQGKLAKDGPDAGKYPRTLPVSG